MQRGAERRIDELPRRARSTPRSAPSRHTGALFLLPTLFRHSFSPNEKLPATRPRCTSITSITTHVLSPDCSHLPRYVPHPAPAAGQNSIPARFWGPHAQVGYRVPHAETGSLLIRGFEELLTKDSQLSKQSTHVLPAHQASEFPRKQQYDVARVRVRRMLQLRERQLGPGTCRPVSIWPPAFAVWREAAHPHFGPDMSVRLPLLGHLTHFDPV